MTAEFVELIADHRAHLELRLASVAAQLDAIRDARSGANDDDEHDPEGATLSTEWSRAEGQRTDAVRTLGELDAALSRLAAGTYGTCASCGDAIPLERLRLLPAATLCVPCASRV
ncbi:transcriptional regulator, TraR/DksA family [Microbacterium sp. cf046]|uniref:TraR/DksA family transcriptional regulator n=1 Tax=Microbacterium sp. cf046 TaxID=1761803 RepID=UPI0008EA36EC|nr:TraR/DksA family transcriptional regulator [Microbacterium sp. cf046]SFS03699.1 transcriptional regulator, TraR/DksA family [Microbacterium sp. cf046]